MSRPSLRPSTAIRDAGAYAPKRGRAPIDLRLDGNEGLAPDPALLQALAGFLLIAASGFILRLTLLRRRSAVAG